MQKITSGLLIRAGCHSCNDPALLTAIKEREAKKEAEQNEKDQKIREKMLLLTAQMKDIREKRGADPGNWTSTDCKCFLQYKKQKGDPKMPTSLGSLRSLCVERRHRPSPSPSPIKDIDSKLLCANKNAEVGHEAADDRKSDVKTDKEWLMTSV